MHVLAEEEFATATIAVAVIAATLAFISLVVAVVGVIIAGKAHRLAKKQEADRSPNLIVDCAAADCTVYSDRREYTFELDVRNRSDRATSVSSAELLVAYTADGLEHVVKLRWQPGPAGTAASGLPLNIEPNHSGALRLAFPVAKEVTGRSPINWVELSLTDTFGGSHPIRHDLIVPKPARVEP